MPTSLRRSLIVWVATSPTCATNFSFRLFACSQPSHGHRFDATYRRSRWNARCMPSDGLGHGGGRRVAVEGVGLKREERRVAFDLDQVEVTGRIDHRFEQPARC